MADNADTTSGRRGYHHGNLREALVEAALELVVEKGPLGFTMAEAARHAGVSAAAPYRHFKNQQDILAEAARQGFEIFAERLEKAWKSAGTSPLAGFEAAGRAYLAFARKNPGHYISMFESGLSIASHPGLAMAADRAMSVLTNAAEELLQTMPPDRRPPASMVSHHIWAMSHGVVELFTRGAPGTRAPFSPEELLETGTGVYLRGLGLVPQDG